MNPGSWEARLHLISRVFEYEVDYTEDGEVHLLGSPYDLHRLRFNFSAAVIAMKKMKQTWRQRSYSGGVHIAQNPHSFMAIIWGRDWLI